MQIMDLFPDNRKAEQWFEDNRWENGITCPHCGSHNIYTRSEEKRKNQPHRCRSCRSDFSVKTGTLMHKSNLGHRAWAVGIYLMTTNLKGISSMKIHRELDITQKSAWLMMHKIRESFVDGSCEKFSGPVEVDETYIGGKESNKRAHKKLRAGRGAAGKATVVGVKDRETNQIKAQVIPSASKPYLHEFLGEVTEYTTPHLQRRMEGLPRAS